MKITFIALLFIYSSVGLACKFVPDERPVDQRVAEAPIAFEGVVDSVDGEQVTFKVTKWMHGQEQALSMTDKMMGIATPSTYTTKMGKTTCDIRFSVGQNWLYAGTSVLSPSKIILDQGSQRLDDSSLSINPKAQICQEHNDCVAVVGHCGVATAVNKQHKEAVQEAINAVPNPMECQSRSDDSQYKALCKGSPIKTCGLFRD